MSDNLSEVEKFRAKAIGTNVNATSLLATDYLNHFNEALMLAEMIADMPDLAEEFAEWRPKLYKDHFLESGIADKDLAVEAYDHCPKEYKAPFDSTVSKINRQLTLLQSSLLKDPEGLAAGEKAGFITSKCGLIRQLIDRAAGIINGQLLLEAPTEIPDKPSRRGMPENEEGVVVDVADGKVLDQTDIDALFD
ncbi:hypothetical protein [Sneathiella glossodoripedis]|uniref:hypothetical protein n=1 Tax=Sneathiella glossodoripedis TaxID=418853 RepID=UPI00046E7948|nr:hypothetical protein [Sneathiella glossodoripedis]